MHTYIGSNIYMPNSNLVPFHIASKLNVLGFNKPSQKYYNIYNKCVFEYHSILHPEAIWAPSYNEVVEWFAMNHNLKVEPNDNSIIEALNKVSFT